MTKEILKRLRNRAHVHIDDCYGRYQPCGEHHMHDAMCGSRPLRCGQREDEDLVALLKEYDRLAVFEAIHLPTQ